MVLDLEERSVKGKAEAISLSSFVPNVLAYIKRSHSKYSQLEGVDEKDQEVVLHTNFFVSMTNLALLQINHLRLEGKFKSFPAELKWLQWQDCPFKCMPSEFWPQELAVLDLTRSRNIKYLWNRKGYKVCFNSLVYT